MDAVTFLKNYADAVRRAQRAWDEYNNGKRAKGYADSRLRERATELDAVVRRMTDQYYKDANQINLIL